MIEKIKRFFKAKEEKTATYDGFSDFFMHASKEDKERVIAEAAHRANEDQLKVFKDARVKTGFN